MVNFLETTHQTVAWFKDRSDQEELIIKPLFQRNPVWLVPQKSLLIDSILKGYPIPELYLQSSIDETGSTSWIVVDGQQRIRACLEFIEGSYALTPSEAPNHPDMVFSDLSVEDKKKVFSYTFIIRKLPEMPADQLRAMFTRLNRNNVALNKQELRNATYWGDFITTIDQLSERPFWVDTGLFTANDFRRMLDKEYISELAVGVLHGPQNKKTSLDKWYAAYEEEFDHRQRIVRVFDAVTAEIARLLPDIRKTRWSKKSDFYTLFLVIASKAEELPLDSSRADRISAKLTSFAKDVDEYLKTHRGKSHAVQSYADAVERAASDLGNRKARSVALETLLQEEEWSTSPNVEDDGRGIRGQLTASV